MKWANSNPAASIGLAGRVAENATAARSELLSKPHLRGGGPGKNRALPIDLLTLDFSGGEALHSQGSKHLSVFRCFARVFHTHPLNLPIASGLPAGEARELGSLWLSRQC